MAFCTQPRYRKRLRVIVVVALQQPLLAFTPATRAMRGLDDAAVIGFGLFIFVELCPQHVVEEHRAVLAGEIPGEWKDPPPIDEDEIVDAEFTEDN